MKLQIICNWLAYDWTAPFDLASKGEDPLRLSTGSAYVAAR
jgi:hypothetical protein